MYDDHVVAEIDIRYGTDADAAVSSSSDVEVKIVKEERSEQQHKQLVWVSNLLYLQDNIRYNRVVMKASDVIVQFVKSSVRHGMVSIQCTHRLCVMLMPPFVSVISTAVVFCKELYSAREAVEEAVTTYIHYSCSSFPTALLCPFGW